LNVIPTVRNRQDYEKPSAIKTTLRLAPNYFYLAFVGDEGGKEDRIVRSLLKRAMRKNVWPATASSMRSETNGWSFIAQYLKKSENEARREVAFQVVSDALAFGVLKEHHDEIVKKLIGVIGERDDRMAINAFDILARHRPKALEPVMILKGFFRHKDERVAIAALDFALKHEFSEQQWPAIHDEIMKAVSDPRAEVSDKAFDVLAKRDLQCAFLLFLKEIETTEISKETALSRLKSISDGELDEMVAPEYRKYLAETLTKEIMEKGLTEKKPFDNEEVQRKLVWTIWDLYNSLGNMGELANCREAPAIADEARKIIRIEGNLAQEKVTRVTAKSLVVF
jgi:hypothetical protein